MGGFEIRGPIKDIIVSLSIAISVIILSCNNSGEVTRSNKDYDKIIDSTNHLVDARKDQQAVHYLDSATNHYKNLTIIQKFLYLSVNYNYYFHIKNDYSRAMIYADSALNLFDTPEKKLKYLPNYDQAFFLKGDVYFNQNKYNEAYQYFYQGKLIANKSITDCTLSDFSYRMGMIMYRQENYRLAAQNFKNSTKETANCELTFGNFYRIQELLNNTGLCFSKVNETDSAMSYFNKALHFIDLHAGQFKDRSKLLDVARAVIYGNQAKIHLQNHNFAQARNLLEESIVVNLRKGNDNHDAELSELKLAHLYYQAGKLDSLKTLLDNVHRQLETVANKDAETDWNFMQANYFSKKNDAKVALGYFLRYDALKDSIAGANKALKDADIARQIKHLEKDYELGSLKKDIGLQNIYLKLGGIFAAMLLIIIFLVLLNWQKSKKNIKTLGILNHQINDQNTSLEQALEELKLSSDEKDRIMRTVAHDLRNPIGGIVSLTQAMADDGYNAEQKEMLSLIQETSNNSLELINEILESTNNVQAVLKKEMVEINSMLSHNIDLLRFRAAEKDQKITTELLKAPCELFISREKIWRVISNLISNAIKFSPAGSGIHVKITDRGDEVEIAVKDKGIGIPDDMKPKVFSMFSDAKRIGTAGEKSFGLGLSICKQIIENHQGKIWFESNTGKGTTFYIRLPKR